MAKDIPLWYHPGINGEEATKIITKFKSSGAFLLRDSEKAEGAFTLTVSCGFDEAGNFVDVKNYRIPKDWLKNKHLFKTTKKKYPSVKDLEKYLHQHQQKHGGNSPRLTTPVEIPKVEEWNAEDGHWRQKIKVEDKRRHSHAKDSPDPNDPDNDSVNSGTVKSRKGNKKLAEETSPYLNLLKDGKNSEEAAVAQSASNSGSHDGNLDTTEPNRDGEVLDSNETADKDDGHAIKNDQEKSSLNQDIGPDKREEDRANNDNDDDTNKLTEPIATNDTDVNTNIDSECISRSNSNHPTSPNSGIYMLTGISITRNNTVTSSNSSFSQGVYMTTAGINSGNEISQRLKNEEKDTEHQIVSPNREDKSILNENTGHHEQTVEKTSHKNHENANWKKSSNDGIYMVSTKQNKGADTQISVSSGIYMAGMMSRNKPRDHEDGATHAQKLAPVLPPKPKGYSRKSVDQQKELSSGIYMSSKQATSKNKAEPIPQGVGVGSSATQAKDGGIYVTTSKNNRA